MKSYEGFIKESVSRGEINIIDNKIFLNNKIYQTKDGSNLYYLPELAYRTLFWTYRNNFSLSAIAKGIIDSDIANIESIHNNEISKSKTLYYYTLNFINTQLEISKDYLLPVIYKVSNNLKYMGWGKIMTNCILNRYLMCVYNYNSLKNKKINFADYLSFLSTNYEFIFAKGEQTHNLHDKILGTLKNTTREGIRNELGAKRIVEMIQTNEISVTKPNFSPLVTGIIKDSTYSEDLNGIDFYVGANKIQVKPLVGYNTSEIKVESAGRIIQNDGYDVKYYMFILKNMKEKNHVEKCIIINKKINEKKQVIIEDSFISTTEENIMIIDVNFDIDSSLIDSKLKQEFGE